MLFVRSRIDKAWGFEDKTWMPVSQDRFPDGTLHMTAPKDSLFKTSNVDIYWKYNNDAELFSLICLRKHYTDCKNVTLYMPYCPHGDEITHIRRLLTEIYPHHNFSMVSDSYDYWNLVEKILPHLKDEIMAHDGCLSIRGDPVEIIAGKEIIYLNEDEWKNLKDDPSKFIAEFFERDLDKDTQQIFSYNGEYALADITVEWTNERGAWTDCKYWYIEGYDVKLIENYELTSEDKGTVWCLWDIFGGTINSKGYKVLDPHIKAIYGDSITPQRCTRIYQRLVNNRFAINNVSLGVGSFSFMCLEEDGCFNPYTRDTFGIAVKATYAEMQMVSLL